MHDIAFPARKTDGARRVDNELATVLEQMTSSGEPITVRAVVRRMTTLSQPSSITRDVWRMGRIATAEQERIRTLADGLANLDEGSKKQTLGNKIVPDIGALLSFVGIARVGNFGQAARELDVDPRTLSRQIQTLEDAFETRLLIRHSRGATLTQAGSRLLRRLDTALPLLTSPLDRDRGAQVDTGALSLRQSETGTTLSLGVTSELGGSVIPRIIRQFRARWPHLKLNVDEGPSSILEQWLVGHRLDLAILQDPPSLETLYTEPILTDKLGLVASARSPIGDDAVPFFLHNLGDLPLVLLRQQNAIRRRLEKVCFQRGLRLSPILETDSLLLTKVVVHSGQAFTVLPSLTVQDELVRGSLIFHDIERPAITTVYAVAANRENMSPILAEAIAIVREAMISLVGSSDQGRAELIP
jgi:LysR family transcriptional regulator, nitrogen assimilation regulatory protein